MSELRNKKIFTLLILLILVISMLIALIVTKNAEDNNTVSKTEKSSQAQTQTKNNKTAADIVKAYADKNGYTMSDYPEDLIKLLDKAPESKEFVLEYPKEKNKQHTVDIKKYKNCESVPLFIQWDTQWGYAPYGNGIVGLDGCGPTCLSMVAVYYLKDTKYSPDYIAKFSYDNGYYVDGIGTDWSLITKGGKKLGLDVKEIPLDEGVVINNIKQKKAVICSVGPGDFTQKGHFIVITDYSDGVFTVNDPNSYSNSDKKWSYDRLHKQIKNMWTISKA